jgi:general secretion pathway protein H
MRAGFTLIEMLVVLTILGLTLALVAAHGPMRSAGLEMHSAAGQVADALRLARTRAIASNRRTRFSLDPAQHGFQIDGGALHTLPAQLAVLISATGGPPRRDRIGGIVFAPDGSSSGGSIELADGQRRTLISVDWLSGRITVADGQ